MSLVFEIIAFAFVALNSPLFRERILVIASQCVNKQAQDFRHYQDRNFRPEILSE